MGDLITSEVTGDLQYISYDEFERINKSNISLFIKAKIFAGMCRINTLYMIAKAGSGHIGSSFSSMDILVWLYLNEMNGNVNCKTAFDNDIFFSSKGHDAPALYSVLIGLGKLKFDMIHKLRKIDGLPGHPDISIPNIITNTGSLGMGISKAKGMIFANRLLGKKSKIFVITGDGELQEGQIWESLISAANYNMEELTVIVDHNKLQSDTTVKNVSDLGNLEAKFAAFGWHVSRCNGNDVNDFSKVLNENRFVQNLPKVIIADTIKGKGVSFMEHTSIDSDVEFYKFHSGAPSNDAHLKALQELIILVNNDIENCGLEYLSLEKINHPKIEIQSDQKRMIPAYTKVLIEEARKNPKIVALDADLILDTGLITYKEEFPDRFLECGIAEQDMVSQAGGISLMGLLPIVHSFSCFLTSRPNEQIYNNSTELTKIIYVGSLAGVVPGGPGHSHQAVRDISSLSSIPNLFIIEPSCEEEIKLIFDWCVNVNQTSSYLRLVSIPTTKRFNLKKNYEGIKGQGVSIRDGKDALIITYGPILLSNSMEAVDILEDKFGLTISIINLPWLNYIDENWLIYEMKDFNYVFSIDNHFRQGGQGDRIADILSNQKNISSQLFRFCIENKPAHGTNEEVLKFHKLDAVSISNRILEVVKN